MLQKLLKFVKYYNWKLQNFRHDVTEIIKIFKYYNWKLQNLRLDVTKIIKIYKILQIKTIKFKTFYYKNNLNVIKYIL